MHISDPGFEPPDRMVLPKDEVCVWRIDLDTVASAEPRWQRLLSQQELARANRFLFARDRQNFTSTRALLRIILGGYLEQDPRELSFVYSEREKPSLSPLQNAGGIEFNVSHSGSRALLAFARGRELGVDVEQIRTDFDYESLSRRFFSPAEQAELSALSQSERASGFFRCWTRKESYIKAHGAGLSLPLDAFDVSLAPGAQNALLATRPNRGEAALWSLREIDAGEGYEGALCVRGNGWILKM